jgi:flagellar biosynthesis protein FlhB
MSEEDDKQFEPSQKKLDDARARGEIPKSVDLSTAAAYGGFALAVTLGGALILQGFGQTSVVLLGQSDRLAPLVLARGASPAAGMFSAYGIGVLPLVLAPSFAVFMVLLAQSALFFAPEKLAFKLSRISPLAAAKQKFGSEGVIEFLKNSTKMVIVAVILALQLTAEAPKILGTLTQEPAAIMGVLLGMFHNFVFLVMIIAAVFGGMDYLWQRARHIKQNRMSRNELTEEMKETEGDPHIKMQRRQKGAEIATNQMLSDVKGADVIIVNPTHYAVALKWSRSKGSAPICVAKGVDEIAAKIREKAAEAGVPLHRDPPTARAIFATVELGAQILPEHYRAVAAAIRFAEGLRKRAKGLMR